MTFYYLLTIALVYFFDRVACFQQIISGFSEVPSGAIHLTLLLQNSLCYCIGVNISSKLW